MPPNVATYHAVGHDLVGDEEVRGPASLEVENLDEVDVARTPRSASCYIALPRLWVLVTLIGGISIVALRFAASNRRYAAQHPNVLWADEFDGSDLDLTKWSYIIGDGCDVGLCGWVCIE